MHTITIDARMYKSSGIGTYIQNLLPPIISASPEIQYFILGDYSELKKNLLGTFNNVKIVDFKSEIYSINEQFRILKKLSKETELLWSPHYNIPVLSNIKLCVTIHDVLHLAMPQFVRGFHRRLYAKSIFKFIRKKASFLIFNSKFTENEFLRVAGDFQRGKKVIYLGVDDFWQQDTKSPSPSSNPYLLFVGNVKPHKNLITLIESFKEVSRHFPHRLIIVGKKEGFITGDNNSILEAKEFGGRIIFTGHIDNEQLRAYYSHAAALIFPSFYEGFGLPPLEAMACGCPTIVSNAASIPEICGDASLYFNANDPKELTQQITTLLFNNEIKADLISRGLTRKKEFNWKKTARETLAVFMEILDPGSANYQN